MTSEEDRRAALFVVSQIGELPEARAFLVSAAERADRERYWAHQWLEGLDTGTEPGGKN